MCITYKYSKKKGYLQLLIVKLLRGLQRVENTAMRA